MKHATNVVLFLMASMMPAAVFAQAPRTDVYWARTTGNAITLDGALNEPDWAFAETMTVEFGKDSGIPGSGWKIEGGVLPSDSLRATFRFLVKDNQLYMGAEIEDASVGGSIDFNRFDGLLMGLKDHADTYAPKPVSEYFYSWWYPDTIAVPNAKAPGLPPGYVGRWATWPPGSARTQEQIDNWDAVTVVNGTSNDDAANDAGYTVEMRFNLTAMGYDVTQAGGDVVEWNVSVYDCDWYWPLSPFQLSYNRVWIQSPWGNAAWYHEVQIFARPDVTTSSALPYVGPEVFVPDAAGYTLPTIDGDLDEAVWDDANGFDIRFGDDALRQTYPGMGPYRSGQYQATVNGGLAFVADPGDATVKMFLNDSTLYMGFDVTDQVVQYTANIDRWDGFIVTLNDVVLRSPDKVLLGRRLSFRVAEDGTADPEDYLATLVDEGSAEVAITLKPGTTVDTLGTSPDVGYTAELKLHLTRFGYPPDLGNGRLYIGVTLLDGDSFTPYTDSYGTRTWWFREYEGQCCPAIAHLAKGTPIVGIGDDVAPTLRHRLLGSFPNPAVKSTLRYELGAPSLVRLDLFDVAGRLVEQTEIGFQGVGFHETVLDGSSLAGGVYMFRLRMTDPSGIVPPENLTGRLVIVD